MIEDDIKKSLLEDIKRWQTAHDPEKGDYRHVEIAIAVKTYKEFMQARSLDESFRIGRLYHPIIGQEKES